jgi:hypothetical protein
LLKRLNDADAGNGELRELMIQFGAMAELGGRDNHPTTKTERQKKSNPIFSSLKIQSEGGDFSSLDTVETCFEIALAFCADHLFGDLSFVEEQQRGNGTNSILRRERLLFVNVDLADFDLAVVFVGEFIEQRRDHFAGAAPFGPKIHKDGRLGLQNLCGKIFLRECDD